MVLKIPQFFVFHDDDRPPSWIITISIFLLPIGLGKLICITAPNFIKISRTVAEISHLKLFKMVAIRHLGFVKRILGP